MRVDFEDEGSFRRLIALKFGMKGRDRSGSGMGECALMESLLDLLAQSLDMGSGESQQVACKSPRDRVEA